MPYSTSFADNGIPYRIKPVELHDVVYLVKRYVWTCEPCKMNIEDFSTTQELLEYNEQHQERRHRATEGA